MEKLYKYKPENSKMTLVNSQPEMRYEVPYEKLKWWEKLIGGRRYYIVVIEGIPLSEDEIKEFNSKTYGGGGGSGTFRFHDFSNS